MDYRDRKRVARLGTRITFERRRQPRPKIIPKYEKRCPYCPKIIRGLNSTILEQNYDQHIRYKHEKEIEKAP